MGSVTTDNAEPMAVATRHPGRITSASATTTKGSRWSAARLGVTLPRLMASTHKAVASLVFISPLYGTAGYLSNKFLRVFGARSRLTKREAGVCNSGGCGWPGVGRRLGPG